MPTSAFEQIPDVVKAVAAYQPHSILDVGIGCGKYALLLREYMEGSTRPPSLALNPATRELRIDGVEVFEDYVTDVQHLLYDRIMIGDIVDLAPALEAYDVIMLIDVIEHIPRPLAIGVIDQLLGRARRGIVLATPYKPCPQGALFGNPRETHVDLWSKRDFARWPLAQVVTCADQLLVCISKDQEMNPWMTVQILRQAPLWPLRRRWWRCARWWRGKKQMRETP